jgi:uncharacterized protein
MQPILRQRAVDHAVVTLTGPRQSGKTTLACATFPERQHVDLEDPHVRDYARTDPQEFLLRLQREVILDEPHHAPELLDLVRSTIEAGRDERRILLISSNNKLNVRTEPSAALHLLPLAYSEIARRRPVSLTNFGRLMPVRSQSSGRQPDMLEVLLAGGYPRLLGGRTPEQAWLADHFRTVLQRDLIEYGLGFDPKGFGRFMRLCAGRSSVVLNMSALAGDGGICQRTARRWLDAMESCFLITRLPPYRRSFHHRPFKTPKLYFLDTGLLCYLLRVRTVAELSTHPLRGAIFKTFVLSEFVKNHHNKGREVGVSFWRGPRGHEVDLVVENELRAVPVEIKSGRTVGMGHLSGLNRWRKLTGDPGLRGVVVFGGDRTWHLRGHVLLAWSAL